jgi:hypothetical protein
MHGSIAPALVEEATRFVEMVEELAVLRAPPEAQVANLKVGPEVAGRVAMRNTRVLRSFLAILQPSPRAILMDVALVVLQELERLRPQCANRFGAVMDIDVPPIRFVVVLHPSEDIVVDITEEVYVGLDAPVVLHVCEGGVLAEEAAVPAAHLVVRGFVHVLHLLRGKEVYGFVVEVHVDPRGYVPVLAGHQVWGANKSVCVLARPRRRNPRYDVFAFVAALVLLLNSAVNGTSLKKVQG